MRKDFHRVLTTDPRRGHDLRFTEVRRSAVNAIFDEEFSGGKQSMKTQRRNTFQQRKSFGDHIQPLRRFMAKQVGRKWSEVYSEICELFDKRSQQLYHVHEHVLRDFLELNTRMGEDGKVEYKSRWGGWEDIGTRDDLRRADIYVHPITGILCTNYEENEVSRKKTRAKDRKDTLHESFRVHSKNQHLYNVDGVWMVYDIRVIPDLVVDYLCPYADHRRWDWEKLPFAEKALTGYKVLTRPSYTKVDAPGIGSWRLGIRSQLPYGCYYSECRIASRRILKAHGLVGKNEFKEGKALNHRQAAQYR